MDTRIEQNREMAFAEGLAALAGTRLWTIAPGRKLVLLKKLARMNRRAAKLGQPAIELVEVGVRHELRHFGMVTTEPTVEMLRTYAAQYSLDATRASVLGRVPSREWSVVALHGVAPVVAGYAFVARVEHHDGGNIVSRSPLEGVAGVDVTAYRTGKPACVHCNKSRARKDTFVLRAVETGEVRQVGRRCLADYLRGTDPASALSVWSVLSELERDAGGGDDDFGGGGWRAPDPTVTEFLSAAVASARLHGFKPAAFKEKSTASHASFLCGPRPTGGFDARDAQEAWDAGQPTSADIERAAVVIAWVLATTDSPATPWQNDYFHNLRVVVGLPRVTSRNEGLLASTIAAYERARGIEFEKSRKVERPASRHVGEVGASYLLHGTVTRTKGINSDWGGSILVGIETDAGEDLVTFASGIVPDWVQTGKPVWVAGSVKRHSEYNGRPQTQLTRCRFEQERPPVPRVCSHCGKIEKTKKALVAHESTHAVQEVA